jgi:catechol-2,3-dioxygenase
MPSRNREQNHRLRLRREPEVAMLTVMIPVRRISHATLETPDLDRKVEYFTDIVGLAVAAKDKHRAWLATRSGHLAVIVERGSIARMTRIAFQVAPDSDLGAMAKALSGQGIAATLGDAGLPGIGKLLSFRDPKDTTIEVFADAKPVADASESRAVSPMKLGHIAFMMPDIHPYVKFYQEVLGFRISDWQEDFFCFMRCGTDHHTINFATGKSTRVHHMAFELKDWAHVGVACEHLGKMNVPIIWGPGRHGISHNIFLYHRDPDDQMVEFYTEMDQMNEELGIFEPRPWHTDRPQKPKVWDRASAALVWGPPQGPDHARQRNIE